MDPESDNNNKVNDQQQQQKMKKNDKNEKKKKATNGHLIVEEEMEANLSLGGSSYNVPSSCDLSSSNHNMEKGSHHSSNGNKNKRKHRTSNRIAQLDRQTKILSRSETYAVVCFRTIFYVILISVSTFLTMSVYRYVRDDEVQDFHDHFVAQSQRVIESFHSAVERKLQSIDTLSTTTTSYALATNSSFPFVTIPHFDVRGANTRIQSDGLLIYWLPLVTDNTRSQWESYSTQVQGHHYDSYFSEQELRQRQDEHFGLTTTEDGIPPSGRRRQLQEEEEQQQGQQEEVVFQPTEDQSGGDSNGGFRDHTPQVPYVNNSTALAREILPPQLTYFHSQIWGIQGLGERASPAGTGPYLPLHQMTPTLNMASLLNINLLEFEATKGSFETVLNTSQAVLDVVSINLDDVNDETDVSKLIFNLFLSAGQYRHDLEHYKGDPVSTLAYPVFDTFNTERKVVGLFATSLYWRLYFTDILPPNVEGIICVLENSFGQVFSYRIDGPDATYLGPGDHHDVEFDSLEVIEDVAAYVSKMANPKNRGYTAVDLNAEYNNYRLHVYPSTDMKDAFVTNMPVQFAAIVVSAFLFTALLFILYDCLVERRQHIVMDKAVKSTAVVSSLFPDVVRESILNRQQNDGGEVNNHRTDSVTMGETSNRGSSRSWNYSSSTPEPKHLRFTAKNTTVMFGDIAGFTAWSSTRTPDQVFDLLEALYQSFDELAKRRKVFKVETIGDCYLAACGLPDPQPDHAIRMSKFAKECMVKMKVVAQAMESELGDTSSLALRIGMHSGEVTAGVLRGEKARFQLFGDTVNTGTLTKRHGFKAFFDAGH